MKITKKRASVSADAEGLAKKRSIIKQYKARALSSNLFSTAIW